VLTSMTSVQIGAAWSVSLYDRFGPAGTTWLRLAVAAGLLLAVVRPDLRRHRELRAAGVLGLVMAANAVLFAEALDRVPLGVTVAIEFCGPLSVAAIGARAGGARRLAWPLLALAGVLLVTRPWQIGTDGTAATWIGLACAGLAGVGWAAYILLLARVGRAGQGASGLAVALSVAAVALTPFGWFQASAGLHAAASGDGGALGALGRCALLALLMPLAAYSLEMVALRRMDSGVFGVWMAGEPVIGATAGLLLLGQPVDWVQLPGFALVVGAGVGAERASPIARRAERPGPVADQAGPDRRPFPGDPDRRVEPVSSVPGGSA